MAPRMAPKRHTVHQSSRGEALTAQSLAGTPGGTRIPNLLIRSQTLYPIELRALATDKVIRRAPYIQAKEWHLCPATSDPSRTSTTSTT